MANCTRCGRQIFGWEEHYYSSYSVCSDCYRKLYGAGGKRLLCTSCRKHMSEQEAVRKLGTTICKDCYEKEMQRRKEWVCASCKKEIKRDEKKFKTPDGRTLCEECTKKNSASFRMGATAKGRCNRCGIKVHVGLAVDDKTILCKRCAIEHMRNEEKKAKKGEGLLGRFRHFLDND